MAYITKRGNSYSVRYTYEDEHGKSCDKWESFPTKEEATNRKKQIEHELAAGTFLIPSSVTVAEFLMDWLPKQCSKHKWAPKTYESNLSTIQNLIIPYISSMEMQKLKPYHMENLYTTLSKTPCSSYIEGKKQELTEKQKQRFLSGTTIHEVHRLLGTAFQYAVEWGILVKSPVPVDFLGLSTGTGLLTRMPHSTAYWKAVPSSRCTSWIVVPERKRCFCFSVSSCFFPSIYEPQGALREGEIVGLTPEDLDFDAADGIGTFRINKSMLRVRKEALNQVDDGCIIKIFPDKLERSTTSLILPLEELLTNQHRLDSQTVGQAEQHSAVMVACRVFHLVCRQLIQPLLQFLFQCGGHEDGAAGGCGFGAFQDEGSGAALQLVREYFDDAAIVHLI